MSVASPAPPRGSQFASLRPELRRLLDRLRSQIRRYVLIEGGALLLALAGGLFWLSLGVDWSWFRLTNLEPPQWVRATLLVIAGALLVAAAGSYLVLRLSRRLRPRALALVLERRFPELDDRLIFAVERAEEHAERGDAFSEALITRTIDDVSDAADRIDLAQVFDRRPLRRVALAALIAAGTMVGLAVVAPAAYATWWKAYGRLEETYRERTTTLQLFVLAPPDDRLRELAPGDVYKHPRGANLTLLVEVPERPRPDGKPWAVPESIVARRRDAAGSGSLPVTKTADRQFRLTIEEVRNSLELNLTGGDYTNRVPFHIEVVDPPRVEAVRFDNYYPLYTRLSDRDEAGRSRPRSSKLTGTQAEVPFGTLVVLHAVSNKPIRNARVRLGDMELTLGRFGEDDAPPDANLAMLGGATPSSAGRQKLPESFSAACLGDEPREITIPLLVSDDPVGFAPAVPTDRPDLPSRPVLVVGAKTPVRIVLGDTDRVASLEAAQFTLVGREDDAPEVRTQLRGVSSIITRTAVVPVAGSVRDDYGLTEVRFDYKLDDETDWRPHPLARPPLSQPTEFLLDRSTAGRPQQAPVEWIDTATLDLKLGQRLTLAVAARDGDTLTGPHLTRGDQYVFTIVTREELLTALYNSEINLRKRFEQSLEEMRAVQRMLQDAGRNPAAASPTTVDPVRTAVDRSLGETRQNAGEVRAVSMQFQEILEQLVNNRVHTERQLDRIRQGILLPMDRLNGSHFPRLDEQLGAAQVRLADAKDAGADVAAALETTGRLVAEMEAALQEMQDLAEFHEAIQDLSEIFNDQDDLKKLTEDEQKRNVLRGLDGLLD